MGVGLSPDLSTQRLMHDSFQDASLVAAVLS